MKNVLIRSTAVFLLLAAGAIHAEPPKREASLRLARYVPGEVLVQFRDAQAAGRGQSLHESVGARRLSGLARPGLEHIQIPRTMTVEEAIGYYQAQPDVVYAQPNYRYEASLIPNDPGYSQLWGLKNTGQTVSSPSYGVGNPGMPGNDMGLENAWDLVTDCSSVIVAVIDSGVNYNHEDLTGRMWTTSSVSCPVGGTAQHGCDFVGPGAGYEDNDPMDFNGHGTHVAGTIAAAGNNGTGSTGVCWNSTIMALRVLDSRGSGASADIVQAVNFAAANGARVINMSLGGPALDPALSTAISTARTNGVLVVVAAGNDGLNLATNSSYPCELSQDNILCVAAVDQNYALAPFSNYDANASVSSRTVDVAAPGTNIRSLWAGQEFSWIADYSNWTFSNVSGTPFGVSSCNVNGLKQMLLFPNDCTAIGGSATGNYANNSDARAYKELDTTGLDSVYYAFASTIDLPSADVLEFWVKDSSGDPAVGGVKMSGLSSADGGSWYWDMFDMPACINKAVCSVGFRVTSDASGARSGTGIQRLQIQGIDVDSTNRYNVIDGTSMATPHVAGIAALLFADNPAFTYLDVSSAILNSGDAVSSVSGGTKSGRVVDAYQALRYINVPTGVSITVN